MTIYIAADYQHCEDYYEGKYQPLKIVLMGTQSYLNRFCLDDGSIRASPRYSFGMKRNISPSECLQHYQQDLCKYGQDSKYYGSIYYPCRADREYALNDPVSNQAFWAGAMQVKKTFLLVTPIEHFNYKTGTVFELLWLEDNGYKFSLYNHNNRNYIMISPPDRSEKNPEIVINDYEGCSDKYIIKRLRAIKSKIKKLTKIANSRHNMP